MMQQVAGKLRTSWNVKLQLEESAAGSIAGGPVEINPFGEDLA
jgi:hypothetical protein